jgi:hypothetical protein
MKNGVERLRMAMKETSFKPFDAIELTLLKLRQDGKILIVDGSKNSIPEALTPPQGDHYCQSRTIAEINDVRVLFCRIASI